VSSACAVSPVGSTRVLPALPIPPSAAISTVPPGSARHDHSVERMRRTPSEPTRRAASGALDTRAHQAHPTPAQDAAQAHCSQNHHGRWKNLKTKNLAFLSVDQNHLPVNANTRKGGAGDTRLPGRLQAPGSRLQAPDCRHAPGPGIGALPRLPRLRGGELQPRPGADAMDRRPAADTNVFALVRADRTGP